MKKTIILLLIAALLGALAWWVLRDDRSSAAPLTTADFAIADTSKIGRIDISSSDGNAATIARGEGSTWIVNDKFPARRDAIDLILKTLHLLEIKHPVSAGSRENVIRMMAGRHSYVKVYDRKGKFIKGYYVGIMTPDQRGTYMILERPGIGRTEIPYVMTMKTFYGYLTSRFFTDETDWRDLTLFRYSKLDFNRVEVTNHLYPERSFAITYGGGNDLKLIDPNDDVPVPKFDTLAVKDYLLLYKRGSSETYNLAFEQHQIDSVLRLPPSFEIQVTANNPEHSKHLRLYLRPAPEDQLMDDNTPAVYDREIMYGTLDGKELFRVQRYVFDPFLPPKQLFTGELDF
jgi:hypothetical protein